LVVDELEERKEKKNSIFVYWTTLYLYDDKVQQFNPVKRILLDFIILKSKLEVVHFLFNRIFMTSKFTYYFKKNRFDDNLEGIQFFKSENTLSAS